MDDLSVAIPPGRSPHWMAALDSHSTAVKLIDWLRTADKSRERQWDIDGTILRHATPFAWSAEPTAACLAASRSIPLDTPLNEWNLATAAAWWRFDQALPFQTLVASDSSGTITADDARRGIRALCLGWVQVRQRSVKYPAGTPTWVIDRALAEGPTIRCLGLSAWLDDPMPGADGSRLTPSQTFTWHEGETLGDMLGRVRAEHDELYGSGGRWEKKAQVGEAVFMAATEGVARFVLAALAWLNQKVLVESRGHVERHARKRYDKEIGGQLDAVRVVGLRKTQRPARDVDGHTREAETEWSCRWQVDGHFRNQACGPKHGDRRLMWISPYVKGPEDKELRVPARKVYTVNR